MTPDMQEAERKRAVVSIIQVDFIYEDEKLSINYMSMSYIVDGLQS
jgi:hypothetical protein